MEGFFSGKDDSVILLGFECTINPQTLLEIVWALFEKMDIFLMWTTCNFKSRSKTKKRTGGICKGTQDVECERDWSIGLSAYVKKGMEN